MSRFKKGLLFVVISMIAIIGTACSESDASGTSKGKLEKLSFVTGGSGGVFYPLGGGMAKAVNDNGVAQITVETSGGSVENTRLVGAKEADIGLLETGIAFYAAEGIEMFEGEKYDNVRAIMGLYPNLMQMVVKSDSGIDSYEDLAGKKVVVGQPGSSSMLNLNLVLEEYGLSIDDLQAQYSGFAEGIDMLKDGQVEAVLVDVGVPAAAIIDISSQHKVKILSMDEDKIMSIQSKYPYFTGKVVIPAGTYKNQDEDVITAGVKVMLATHADLPDDLVYEITKTIFEEKAKIAGIHSSGESIDLNTADESLPIPLHPGAEKYINENK